MQQDYSLDLKELIELSYLDEDIANLIITKDYWSNRLLVLYNIKNSTDPLNTSMLMYISETLPEKALLEAVTTNNKSAIRAIMKKSVNILYADGEIVFQAFYNLNLTFLMYDIEQTALNKIYDNIDLFEYFMDRLAAKPKSVELFVRLDKLKQSKKSTYFKYLLSSIEQGNISIFNTLFNAMTYPKNMMIAAFETENVHPNLYIFNKLLSKSTPVMRDYLLREAVQTENISRYYLLRDSYQYSSEEYVKYLKAGVNKPFLFYDIGRLINEDPPIGAEILTSRDIQNIMAEVPKKLRFSIRELLKNRNTELKFRKDISGQLI